MILIGGEGRCYLVNGHNVLKMSCLKWLYRNRNLIVRSSKKKIFSRRYRPDFRAFSEKYYLVELFVILNFSLTLLNLSIPFELPYNQESP